MAIKFLRDSGYESTRK